MLPACIVLAFFPVVFPVSNGLLPKCHLTCNDTGIPSYWAYDSPLFHSQIISIECFIKTPQTSKCTFDVSQIVPSSCNQNEFRIHYVKLVCDNTHYRPNITHEQNISCDTYHGYLHVKKCGLLWQDLDAYGEFLPLYKLYLEDFEGRWDEDIVETDYWKKHLDLRDGNESGITDSQIEPVAIPNGLREVAGLIFNMDNKLGILKESIWPRIEKLVFTHIQLSYQFTNIHFQTIFPRLQRLDAVSCNLTQPPLLILSGNKTSVLPGNLYIIEKIPYSVDIWKDNFQKHILRLYGNRITDLSNCTLKGHLHTISLTGNNLTRVNGNLFMNIQGLHTIYLNSNKLSSIPAGLFRNQDQLVSISLADNLLTGIPVGLFTSLPFLTSVDLSDNLLTDIPAGLFKSTSSLKNVNLSDNSLTHIPAGLFESLPSLENVDLSDNMLTDIPAGLFKSTSSLKNVNLSDNLLPHSCRTL